MFTRKRISSSLTGRIGSKFKSTILLSLSSAAKAAAENLTLKALPDTKQYAERSSSRSARLSMHKIRGWLQINRKN